MISARNIFLLGLLSFGSLQTSLAADTNGVHPYLSDTFFIDVGGFFPDRRFGLRVDGSAGEVHEEFEFDEAFGAKKADQLFSFQFAWRFGEKWHLFSQFFESSSSSSWVLEEDIEWEDVIFQSGSNANTGTEFLVLRAFFAREFNAGPNHEFGLGAGFHWLEIAAHIEGTIIDEAGGTESARESVSVSGPLPNIGAWYNYSISDRWAFVSRIDFFSANVGRYDGEMTNFSTGINYQVARNFGLGLNYNYFDLNVEIDKTDWRGRVDTNYRGLFANLSFYW